MFGGDRGREREKGDEREGGEDLDCGVGKGEREIVNTGGEGMNGEEQEDMPCGEDEKGKGEGRGTLWVRRD
jgi:hypothetical protein